MTVRYMPLRDSCEEMRAEGRPAQEAIRAAVALADAKEAFE